MRAILLVIIALVCVAAQLEAATATWNANPELDIAGYTLSYGTAPGVYTVVIDVANVLTWTVPPANLTPGVTYYFALQAYDTAGLMSPYSAEVIFVDGTVTVPGSEAFK